MVSGYLPRGWNRGRADHRLPDQFREAVRAGRRRGVHPGQHEPAVAHHADPEPAGGDHPLCHRRGVLYPGGTARPDSRTHAGPRDRLLGTVRASDPLGAPAPKNPDREERIDVRPGYGDAG